MRVTFALSLLLAGAAAVPAIPPEVRLPLPSLPRDSPHLPMQYAFDPAAEPVTYTYAIESTVDRASLPPERSRISGTVTFSLVSQEQEVVLWLQVELGAVTVSPEGAGTVPYHLTEAAPASYLVGLDARYGVPGDAYRMNGDDPLRFLHDYRAQRREANVQSMDELLMNSLAPAECRRFLSDLFVGLPASGSSNHFWFSSDLHPDAESPTPGASIARHQTAYAVNEAGSSTLVDLRFADASEIWNAGVATDLVRDGGGVFDSSRGHLVSSWVSSEYSLRSPAASVRQRLSMVVHDDSTR